MTNTSQTQAGVRDERARNIFRRVLVANRGEVAVRVIRSCRQMGIESVAVFSEADRHSPHLDQADHSVCIGPGPSQESYLNREAILEAAIGADCQALHPGYGFLAEDQLFAAMCEQQKLTFIGPSARMIRLMGDKSQARRTVTEAGLPTIPGSRGNLHNLDDALELADTLGYPVMLKATAGGGGKGIRPCRDGEELRRLYPQARLESEKAFGNPALYMEKIIVDGRHIEFQVLGDAFGHSLCLGERECSMQRKHQKLIEECPSPAVDAGVRHEMCARINTALARMGYRNAGTMEFLMDRDGQLYFMEMNTRLQVEHPITEEVYGVDIVREQIRIAANHPLSMTQSDVRGRGHAIECRINAEDPANGFRPDPGRIETFRPGEGKGPGRVRIDTFIAEGFEIPPYYDSMICKVIAWGEDRTAAIDTMIDALHHFEIRGIKTTVPLHLDILNSDAFRSGRYHINTLTHLMGASSWPK